MSRPIPPGHLCAHLGPQQRPASARCRGRVAGGRRDTGASPHFAHFGLGGGQLVAKRRIKLVADPLSCFQEALGDGMVLASMPPSVLIAASLPSSELRDPAARILAATARTFGYRLMTRDRPLLEFGAEGHLQAIAC